MTRLNMTSTGGPTTVKQESASLAAAAAQAAFAALVDRHSPMVLGVCRRMLPMADAEDAAQAVFILFWQKAIQLRDEPHIAGWLHRTARHVCRNAQRSHRSRVMHEQQAAAEFHAMTPESDDQAQWQEIQLILDDEVNQLPEKLRLPFVLFHLENRSLAEVAELTRSTVPTVGTWLQRSREKLAGRLRKRGIVLGAASLGALLSRQATAEVVPDAFVSATVQMTSAAGVAACTPAVASLVLAGAPGGVSKLVWILSSLAVTVIGFPLTFIWLLPELQTRQSPDFPLLQGEWREVAHEQNGGPLHAQNPVPYVGVLHITGRNYRFLQTLPDGRVLEGNHGSFVLDGSPAPSTIDFRQWQGTVYGRYDLDGDTLTICVTRHGGPRPDKLSTTANDDRILTRYERSK